MHFTNTNSPIDFPTPDYAMYTDFGNDAVHSIVRSARILKLDWSKVYSELQSLAERFPDDFGEATDTAVRESVYIALGFDKRNNFMNERIKELAEQCTEVDSVGIDETFHYRYDLEKFAELIVRECAKVLDDKLANPNGASIAWCDGSDLLEHFGVEE